MRVNSGADLQARVMGGGGYAPVSGTASSAPTATTLTDSTKTFTVNSWVGYTVVVGSVFGVVLSNTATALTIDMWHAADGSSSENVGTTPSSGATYAIIPGGAPAWYIGLSVSSNAPTITDTYLSTGAVISELWAAGGGLNRKRASWSHTVSTTSYALVATFTANVNDGASNTVQKAGVFASQVTASPTSVTSGPMMFETAVPNPPVLVPADSVQITDTVTI